MTSTLKVILLIISAGSLSQSSSQTDARLERTFDQINRRSVLSGDDQAFLLKEMHSGPSDVRLLARRYLIFASRKNLFPKQRIRDLIESETKLGTWLEASLCANDFYRTVDTNHEYLADKRSSAGEVDRQISIAFNYLKAQKTQHSPLNVVTKDERGFITTTLKCPFAEVRALVGGLAVEKQKLNSDSRNWLLARISSQIQASDVPHREYWEFIRRVIEYRNPYMAGRSIRHSAG